MLEFIILPAGGDADFQLPAYRYGEVLHPNTVASVQINGYGTHSIEIEGCEIYFSDEQEGFQVVFECDDFGSELARRVISEICTNIEQATGQKTVVIEGMQG